MRIPLIQIRSEIVVEVVSFSFFIAIITQPKLILLKMYLTRILLNRIKVRNKNRNKKDEQAE